MTGASGRLWLLLPWWLGFPALLAAQQETADSLPLYRLDLVRVSVTRMRLPLSRLPYSVSVRNKGEIQAGERAVALDEVLRSIPGVFAQNRRNFSLGDRLAIRGVGARAQFGVRGLRIVADGIPLTLADGQSTLTNLDLASAGRVEVLRGPASALYGNAAGGVVTIRSERPADRPLRATPRVLFGSHGFLQQRLKASGRIGGYGYLLSGNHLYQRGFREHSQARLYRINAVVGREGTDGGSLRAVVNLFRTPFSENPSSLTLEDARAHPRMARPFIIGQGAGEKSSQAQGGLTLVRPWGQSLRFRVSGWGLSRDVWNPIPGRIIDLRRTAGGLRGELRGQAAAGGPPIRWIVGFDFEAQRDRRRELENLGVGDNGGRAREGGVRLHQAERVLGLAPFAEAEIELGSRVSLTAAGRADVYRFRALDRFLSDGDDGGRRTFHRFSPMVGLSISPARGLRLFANYATAFQTPTTSELSNRPDGRGGFNPELNPERVSNVELGARGSVRSAALSYGLTGFRETVEDALIPFQGPSEEVFFRNAGEVERWGVELALGWRPLAGLRTDLAYTWQHSGFNRFLTEAGNLDGNLEPGVPGQMLTVEVVHSSAFGLRSELDARWVDAYPVNDANSASNPSYRVVDLRLSLDRSLAGVPLRPFLGIDNLFDEGYNGSVVPNAFGNRYYEPAPGIELFGGLEFSLTRSGK
ncbi:MAG: TonB-dependent receptor family protein [Gemmatimonadota bacterium]